MSEQNPEIHVNIAFKYMRTEDFEFLGLQSLHPELYFSGDDADAVTVEKADQIKEELVRRSFSPTFHAPFYDLNPGAHDSRIRQVVKERYLWALEQGRKFGARHVILHPGYGPWVLKKDFSSWLTRARPVLDPVVERAKELGLKIAFENIYDDSWAELAELISVYPAETVGVCFDVGHFNIFSEKPMAKWLEALGPRILELHLHDNLGAEDLHIAIGDGSVKFSPLIQWLKGLEKMPVLGLEMEQKTHVIKSVSRLRQWFEGVREA